MYNEAIGIFAAIFELLAIWLVGSKNKLGFAIGLVCNFLWIYYVLSAQQTYGLLFVASCAAILNIRGWLAWRNN